MTSNGDSVLNTSTTTTTTPAATDQPPQSPHIASAPQAKPPSPAIKRDPAPLHNGLHDDDLDAEGESEAETVVLSRDDTVPEKDVIKTERIDDDDAVHLRSIKAELRAHSPQPNGRRRSSNGKDAKTNGINHGSERDAKSPVPASPSSYSASRHPKDASPSESAKSPVQPAHSPAQTSTRGRSASTVENRKRKLRDGSSPKSIEPPRQKAKTEGLKDPRLPNSPATPGFGRLHKRSQSTQSAIKGVAGRKRREVAPLAFSNEPEHWSGSSSEHSLSPQPPTAAHNQHARVKHQSHRTLTSPARTMVHRKTDRFGATRLAREAEKGDLDAVKEAYEEAPDELDQVDYAGIAPLQKASLHGWADVVLYLIKKGCRTQCESHDRDTPLIDAVENGHLDVVQVLLNQGQVNPHHQNKKGQRAIDVLDHEDEDASDIEKELRAAMKRHVDTASNNDRDHAQKQSNKSAPRLLYNEYNVETLIEKAGDGDILAVGELMASNIKPNITCGVAAARGGHYDILSILLASGLKADPDPSKHPETPMTVAIGRGHVKIVELLLEQDNFDPTRRNKEGKAYFEISEERRGPRWEFERDILKRAYDKYEAQHRSPRRTKKEAQNPAAMRTKRKLSPRRERSSSPRTDVKRVHIAKPATAPAAVPQKSRRLMSGKEKASREGQRRKRVVDDETSEEESEEDVRPPTRKVKHRSYSEGVEDKPARKALKARSDDNETKRPARARSHESDDDHGTKPSKIRYKSAHSHSAKATPEVDSPDERKSVKHKIKYKTMEDKIRKRKLSDATADNLGVKKTPSTSTNPTPAPPDRTATPEVERARQQEERRLQMEAKRKAAEAAAEAEARKKEAEEAARKAAEEEEAEARQKAAAEAEAARKQQEEDAKRRAKEEAQRQEALAARQDRISKLPKALRRACELGTNRPLHFSGEELGISAVFLPLFYATAQDLDEPNTTPNSTYICSFQLVGILGLAELDLAQLDAPYSEWSRIPVTRKQREAMLRQYDVALLAQDYRFPMAGTPEFDYAKIQESIKEAKHQFSAMEGLYWIQESLLHSEIEKVETLRPLLEDIRSDCKRRHIHFAEIDDKPQKTHKPRKSFMDFVLAHNGINGVAAPATVNGNG
ncbi:hypothetical protein ACN47E_001733 [Coniothyrium glycines]